jgi:hypothetical protein
MRSANRQFDLLVGSGLRPRFYCWTLSGDTNVNFADSIDLSIGSGGQTIPGIDDEQFVHSGIWRILGQPDSLGHLSQVLPTLQASLSASFWLTTQNRTMNSSRRNGNKLDGVDMEVRLDKQFVVLATGPSTDLQFGFKKRPERLGLDDISVRPIPIALRQCSKSDANN